jgi:hypothetical protein
MWEAKASKPGSPDRTTDHTPLRTNTRHRAGHLHAKKLRTASARQDANGAHQRMTIMK